MKRMMFILTLGMVAFGASGCDGKRADLKSPCVGAEDSPCGPKRHVNDWWIA